MTELTPTSTQSEPPADTSESLYQRALVLVSHGRNDDARETFIAAIAEKPTHFGALNDLGTLLYNTDFRSAARLAYAEAVRHHPANPIGHINLANAFLANGQSAEARDHYEIALRLAPEHPDAHQGLANLLQDQGEHALAEQHRQSSYSARGVTALPYRGDGAGCRVLLLVSAIGGNVPTRYLFDEHIFAVSILVVEAQGGVETLPPHDLIFNAVGDADLCTTALDAVDAVLARSGAPVINPPDRVRATGRATIATSLAGAPGVRTPRVVRCPRGDLTAATKAFAFPLLLRSPGYHTGRYFEKIERSQDLMTTAAKLPGLELLLIEFLDARDDYGRAQKYRVMMIGGKLFALHLAFSGHWKVHYFTADMADEPGYRTEEAAFLTDMAGTLGASVMDALGVISTRLGLDYGGIDFSVGADGKLLLFEANATMVVNPPDTDPRWDYRRGPIERILAATQALLLERAKTSFTAQSN